jgi:L-fuculose-phosphate aldolase
MKRAFRDAREEICFFSNLLCAYGLNAGPEGNLSIRHERGFYISPKGRLKALLTKKDIAFIDWKGEVLVGSPSSEWGLHYKSYLKNPNLKAIAHAHPPYLLTLDALRFDFKSFSHPEAKLLLSKLSVLPYFEPGSESLWEFAGNLLVNYQIVVLRNHGVVAGGSSLEEAVNLILLLEKLCQLEYLKLKVKP